MSNNTADKYITKPQVGGPVDRRNFLKLTGAGVAAGMIAAVDAPLFAQTLAVNLITWDKLQSFFGIHLAGAKAPW